jgi:hypothetical protein
MVSRQKIECVRFPAASIYTLCTVNFERAALQREISPEI